MLAEDAQNNWDESFEKLLEKYADESAIREQLHRNSFYYYSKWNNYLQLPIIVLSAVSGSMQFLSQSYKEFEKQIITSTGTLSVLVSLISAISTYLKFGESKKTHENATNMWLNLYHEIRFQLSLRRELRVEANEFVKSVLNKYNHLFEISPIIINKQSFILKVKKKLKNNNEFQVPCYLNGMKPTKTYQEDDEKMEIGDD